MKYKEGDTVVNKTNRRITYYICLVEDDLYYVDLFVNNKIVVAATSFRGEQFEPYVKELSKLEKALK